MGLMDTDIEKQAEEWKKSYKATGNNIPNLFLILGHAEEVIDALLDELKRLRHESEVWEKESLVAIVKERDELREALEEIAGAGYQPNEWPCERAKQALKKGGE
jgi:hypothetical protein